jgi:predicted AlkP superfamily phosphohydrolase/phosphomutase
MSSGKKVLVIGIDGGDWRLLQPFLNDGCMPNLDKIINSGSWGILESTVPPITPVAWSSFQTGSKPLKHGVLGFRNVKVTDNNSVEYSYVDTTSLSVPTLWQYLSELGKEVGVINLPMTYPPQPVKGFMVTGFPTPSNRANYTYPRELKEEILKFAPLYSVPIPARGRKRGIAKSEVSRFIEKMIDVVKTRVKVASYLQNKLSWDVLMVHFQAPDWVQHSLWPFFAPEGALFDEKIYRLVSKFYTALDEAIRVLSKSLREEDTVIIISDHGFQDGKKVFRVNQWLMQRGYLIKGGRDFSSFLKSFASGTLRRLDVLSLRKKLLSRQTRISLQSKFLLRGLLNWEDSLLYVDASGTNYGMVYFLNRDGVDKASLIREIKDIKNPATGEKVVEACLPGSKIYGSGDGKHLAIPDYVIVLKEGYVFDASLSGGPVFKEKEVGKDFQIGAHRLDGIFIFKGPFIKVDCGNLKARIIDIMPTLLHCLSLPIPSYVDGDVLEEIFVEGFMKKNPLKKVDYETAALRQTSSLSQEEQQQIEARLRDLGYL